MRARIGLGVIATGLVASVLLAPVATADHPDFDLSDGIYRIPYADGTEVTIGGDNHTHGGDGGNRDRVDMGGQDGTDSVIVAAASGWIRAVVDHNGNSDGNGDGVDINGDPQDDSLEHACQDDDDVVGDCTDYNNYVWIEHPNGEWTKYSHMATGEPSANGWDVGDWIDAGDVLGTEDDIGFASGTHLHWEVAVPSDPSDDTPFSELGGFIQGTNSAALICDIAGDPPVLTQGDVHEAAPCDHQPPTADAGGPYVVDEGTVIVLDGSGSSDPEGEPLTFAWDPSDTYDAVEGPATDDVALTVYDRVEQLPDTDTASIEVLNVAPTVTASDVTPIDEGEDAVLSATFTDPGTLDTHTVTVDWGDGDGPEVVSAGDLASGISHTYGDNGSFDVTVTVTDDDGGVGDDTVMVSVGNLEPTTTIDDSAAVSFPGGDYQVVEAGGSVPLSADGADAGSDDLTFAWSSGDTNTYFNDGLAPDPFPSPDGTFPFEADDSVDAAFGTVGVGSVSLLLSDDDGGAADDDVAVIVMGNADDTRGRGWWKQQYNGKGTAFVDGATASAYLDIVRAVSSVFDEAVALTSSSDAHAVLSPSPADARSRATAELLTAWLELASGAVSWDAAVRLSPTSTVDYLVLLASAEQAILDPSTTSRELLRIEQDLSKVRHAS